MVTLRTNKRRAITSQTAQSVESIFPEIRTAGVADGLSMLSVRSVLSVAVSEEPTASADGAVLPVAASACAGCPVAAASPDCAGRSVSVVSSDCAERPVSVAASDCARRSVTAALSACAVYPVPAASSEAAVCTIWFSACRKRFPVTLVSGVNGSRRRAMTKSQI